MALDQKLFREERKDIEITGSTSSQMFLIIVKKEG
jgi:hypothetical protein